MSLTSPLPASTATPAIPNGPALSVRDIVPVSAGQSSADAIAASCTWLGRWRARRKGL
jgi:hypothetical protein